MQTMLTRYTPQPAVPLVVRHGRVSLAIRLVGLYYVFIFVAWPLLQDALGLDSETSRVPLVLGLTMLAAAVTRPARRLDPRVLLMAGLFFLLFMTTSLGSIDELWQSTQELLRNWGMALAIFIAAKSLEDCRFLMRTATFAAMASAAYGCVFVLPPLQPIGATLHAMGFPSGVDLVVTRMVGTAGDPSYFGLLIVPGLLYLLHDSMRRNRWLTLPAAATAFLFLSLLLSFSRTAWVAATVGVLLVLWRDRRHAAKTLLLTAPVLIATIVFGLNDFLASVISDNEARTSLALGNQVDSRTWIWKSYWELAVERPFGYGPGSIETLRLIATLNVFEGSTARPHNLYLILLIERGVQSLVPFLVIVFAAIRTSYRLSHSAARRLVPEVDGVFAILASAAVGMFSLGGLLQVPLVFIALAFALERIVARNVVVPVAGSTRERSVNVAHGSGTNRTQGPR